MSPSPPDLRKNSDVIRLCRFRSTVRNGILKEWANSATDWVVLTGERRFHYLERHPETSEIESRLASVIQFPDEIYRNKADSSVALFYQYSHDDYWMRAVVWISQDRTKSNSIMSFRFAKENELARDRRERRERTCVWRR